MLFSDAVFNIFAGVFDILNDVRQNVAVVLLFLYSIFPNLDAIIRVCMLLCETSMPLFVFRIMFVLIRVYATLNGRGCEKIVFEHLEQLASPNLDSDSKGIGFWSCWNSV